jgi:signal transduction histidine kinase
LVSGGFLYAESLLPTLNQTPLYDRQLAIGRALDLPASLHPLEDFETLGPRFAALQAGEILVLFGDRDERVFYRRLGDTPWVLALGPAPARFRDRAKWVVPLFYCLIAVAVFLWIRPISRDLENLQKSAQAFGRQDFSTRVSIPGGSWLQPLGLAFNSMAERIQWLLKSHRELTHAVSHELRTPLARLRFNLEMLSRADAADRDSRCESMNRDIDELNELIEEMLSYAELNQDNLVAKREPVAIGPWLMDYVANFDARDSQIRLHASVPDTMERVMVDAKLLRRALDNLVGNALRYASSTVTVGLVLNGRCCIHVTDDGPGIPPQKREAVLSAYTRLENLGAGVSHGFGLGLAIVKRIMDLHEGEIIIGTAREGGADVALCWPY